MELELPRECARTYDVERQLASGGFGTVFLARHRALDRSVALKLLNPEALADPDAVDRFVNEARITASLQHPHIVVLLDHGIEDGVPWIAYEYVPATSLRLRLRAGPLPWREAFTLGAQVAAALAVAHAAGILHRDIKPENVLVVDDDTCKVADFGNAKWSSGRVVNTGRGVILGTPAYLAPELIAGLPATPQSDVYALGVMLYEMITGTVPFDGDTVATSLKNRLEYEAVPPSARLDGIPSAVDTAVLKTMARSRSDRFMTAHACHTALLSLVDPAPSGRLAAFRRASRTSETAAALNGPSSHGVTTRTVVGSRAARRSTAVMPALGPTPVRFPHARTLLAAGLAACAFAALAFAVRRPEPPPVPTATPEPTELAPTAIRFVEGELERLWAGSRAREPREALLWSFITDPSLHDPATSMAEAMELAKILDADLHAVEQLTERLQPFDRPAPTLAVVRARLAALGFIFGCRRDSCRIARSIERGAGAWLTAVHAAPTPYDPGALVRLRGWLDRLVHALRLAATGALDARLAALLYDSWQAACFLNHELEHFKREAVTEAMERATRHLRELSGVHGARLGDLAATLISVWRVPADQRPAVLEQIKTASARLAAPETRTVTTTLDALLAAPR